MKYYTLPLNNFAASFNCSSYGAGNYNNGQDCTTTGSAGTASAGGTSGLIDTGVQVVLPILVGVALIAAAVILFIRKPKKQTK
jgi:LPXTG-motif cell wall-anchored protein